MTLFPFASLGRFLTASLSRWVTSVFAVILLILLVGSAYNLMQLSAEGSVALSNYRQQRAFTETAARLAALQKKIEMDIDEMQRFLIEFATSRIYEEHAEGIAQAQKLKERLDADIVEARRLSETIESEELHGSFAKLESDDAPEFWQAGLAMASRYLLRRAGEGDDPLLKFDGQAERFRADVGRSVSLMENLTTEMEQDVEQENWRIDWLRANAISGNLFTMLSSVLASLLGVAAVWNWVTRPLRATTTALRKLAQGETDHDIEGATRADEIGDLARAYGEFRQIILERMAACKKIEEQQEVLALKQRETELLAKRFDAALTNMPLGLLMFDPQQRLSVANALMAKILGLPIELLRPGVELSELLRGSSEHGVLGAQKSAELEGALNRFVALRQKDVFLLQIGKEQVLEFSHHSMADGGALILAEDISERHRAERAAHRLAWFDELTALPNRRSLLNAISARVSASNSSFRPFALLFIDLDHFKQINDTQGHGAGDELLWHAAARLRQAVREEDMVARLGGDEFVILQGGASDEYAVGALAERIISDIQQPFEIMGQEVRVGASIGIAIAHSNLQDTETLLRNADTALYRAKASGRNCWRLFEQQMHAEVSARRRLELELCKAVREGAFEVHFQPILTVKDERVSAFEALLRWRHSERGVLGPSEFIDYAEESGLICQLGDFVLEEACKACLAWPSHIRVAVNISAGQFKRGDLVSSIERALASSGLPAKRLEIEITENLLIDDTARVQGALHRLRDMGVGVSLDDFGTGYSGLSYLHNFPLDRIKMDRTFLARALANEASLTLLRGMIKLSLDLGFRIIVEGVETNQQLDLIRDEWFDAEVQGFLFSSALPPHKVAAFLEARREQRAA
ncbi:MAG TPA: EAL domain-containing protein [Methylocystis sp.]|nr:EAL domain-containing protein [Methylocystis sp.]